MPPRKEAVEQRRSHLAAVVLADTFQQRFRPITVERPNVLLPLVNAPLLDYTLEWLASNEVEEVFLFCCSNADKIQEYVNSTKWGSIPGFDVKVVVSTNCFSAGEAMRLIDQQDVIKDDFVLVSGDCISNMNLKPALEAHKRRREKDNLAIMTSVLMPTTHPSHAQWLGESDVLFCIDPTSQRLLAVKDLKEGGPKHIVQDTAVFSERDAVQLRLDLTESQIYVCSPEVLMLFSDNFDFQNIRRDFITGVLSEEELGNKIYIYELHGEYGLRVHNLRTYDAISRDVINRWVFPCVPDTNSLQAPKGYRPKYTYARRNVYIDQTVAVARSAAIGPDTVIGASTIIGDGCVISASVIGHGCRIGAGVRIQGCYIHDRVTIHDNVTLTAAILCDRVTVKAGAQVNKGAILSYGVVVGSGHVVPAFKRLTLCCQGEAQSEDSDDESEFAGAGAAAGFNSDDGDEGNTLASLAPTPNAIQAAHRAAKGEPAEAGADLGVEWDQEACGGDGAGFLWEVVDKEDEARCSVAVPPASDTVWEIAPGAVTWSQAAAQAGKGGEPAGEEAEDEFDPDQHFKREVSETFLRCVKMRFDQANATIELNALKLAENKTFADCANFIFTTIMGMCLLPPKQLDPEYASLYAAAEPDLSSNNGKLALLRQFKAHLVEWGPLLQKFLREEDDQVDLLLTLEEFCGAEGDFASERGATFAPMFCQVLQIMYDMDIISEEACEAWAGEKEHAEEEEKVFLKKAQPFLTWLQEADSDEESEEEEEDDDD